MNKPDKDILSIIEYRMKAIAIGRLAVRHTMNWEKSPTLAMYFDDKLVIEGKATTFTNCAIEAATIHSRVLLEFLGLKETNNDNTKLREITESRRSTDIAIEHFSGLEKLTISKAVSYYDGSPIEAEAALAYVIYVANKGMAHLTSSFSKTTNDREMFEIAFRGIPELIINKFYIPLDIPIPKYEPKSRNRVA